MIGEGLHYYDQFIEMWAAPSSGLILYYPIISFGESNPWSSSVSQSVTTTCKYVNGAIIFCFLNFSFLKDRKTKTEFDIAMSGQFFTLTMF